jgi:hypothetical protein
MINTCPKEMTVRPHLKIIFRIVLAVEAKSGTQSPLDFVGAEIKVKASITR